MSAIRYTYVSFTQYVSMVFAAIIDIVAFGDRLTGLTIMAADRIVASVIPYQQDARRTRAETRMAPSRRVRVKRARRRERSDATGVG